MCVVASFVCSLALPPDFVPSLLFCALKLMVIEKMSSLDFFFFGGSNSMITTSLSSHNGSNTFGARFVGSGISNAGVVVCVVPLSEAMAGKEDCEANGDGMKGWYDDHGDEASDGAGDCDADGDDNGEVTPLLVLSDGGGDGDCARLVVCQRLWDNPICGRLSRHTTTITCDKPLYEKNDTASLAGDPSASLVVLRLLWSGVNLPLLPSVVMIVVRLCLSRRV